MRITNRYLLFAFIGICAITCWFSIGFYNVDEHFQVLEPGAVKAGWESGVNLPWEFASAIRSGIQPYVVFIIISALHVINSNDPFLVTLLLRLTACALSIYCFLLWRKHFKSVSSGKNLLWYDAALLFWFIPYLSVRLSSEIIGGSLFFISLALIYGNAEGNMRAFFVAGCLASIAFFIRFQISFLIAGFLLPKIIRALSFSKSNAKVANRVNLLSYAVGFALIVPVCMFIDFLFYHQWVFTPWNYFSENVIHSRAEQFGTRPFYYYFVFVVLQGLPLQGIAVIAAFLIFFFRKIKDEITPSILVFLIAHFISPHKEIRFLFPLLFLLPFVFALSMEWVSKRKFYRSVALRIFFVLAIITNALALIFVATQPADFQVAMQRAVYRAIGNSAATVLYTGSDPFSRVGLKMNFYANRDMTILRADSAEIRITEPGRQKVLLVTSFATPDSIVKKENSVCVYQGVPSWVLKLNIADWVSRSNFYRVYELDKQPGNP